MVRLPVAVSIVIVSLGLSTAACSAGGGVATSSSPAAPSPLVSGGAAGTPSEIASIGRTQGQPLTAIIGSGSGIVDVTPTSGLPGFSAEITVNVHGAAPDTDFYIQRAPEIGRANSADGICQRAIGAAPWGPPAPNFVTFPVPLAGPLVVLHTSAGGAGATHITFDLPTIGDGTAFDVMFRLVNDLSSPTNELRTGCFTVVAK